MRERVKESPAKISIRDSATDRWTKSHQFIFYKFLRVLLFLCKYTKTIICLSIYSIFKHVQDIKYIMTGTKDNQLSLHKILPMKKIHNLLNYIFDESTYPFLPFKLFSFWVFDTRNYHNVSLGEGKWHKITYQLRSWRLKIRSHMYSWKTREDCCMCHHSDTGIRYIHQNL